MSQTCLLYICCNNHFSINVDDLSDHQDPPLHTPPLAPTPPPLLPLSRVTSATYNQVSLFVNWYIYINQCLIRDSCSRILTQIWPNIRTREIEADRKSLQSILRDFLWRRLFTKVGCYHEQTFLLIINVLMSGYACAIIGDILLQGHLYVTDNYLGFHSNVFGYVTRVCISSSIHW